MVCLSHMIQTHCAEIKTNHAMYCEAASVLCCHMCSVWPWCHMVSDVSVHSGCPKNQNYCTTIIDLANTSGVNDKGFTKAAAVLYKFWLHYFSPVLVSVGTRESK